MSDRLAEIEARLDAATPGEWLRDATQDDVPVIYVRVSGGASVLFEADWGEGEDAALIAHAPTDLRDLLAVAKAAQEFIEEYRAMNGGEEPGDGPTRRLAWALANLEGGAS